MELPDRVDNAAQISDRTQLSVRSHGRSQRRPTPLAVESNYGRGITPPEAAMNVVSSSLFAALAATAIAAAAQTSPGSPGAPTVQHTPAGIDYISGGAGEEDRASMSARQAEFPFKVVFSASGGEYLVAEKLSVISPQGELVTVRDAGPVVMLKLPPGAYTLEATWQGRSERRTVRVGAPSQTLNWQFRG